MVPKSDRVAPDKVQDTVKPSDMSPPISNALLKRDSDNDSISGSFPISDSYPTISNEFLQSLDVVPFSEEIHLALMDMEPLKSLDDHGNWDTRKLTFLFNNAVIPYILSIHYPDPSDLPDRPIWSLNGKYSFDIKSAYSSLSGSSCNVESQSWKKIWSLQNLYSMSFVTAVMRKKSGDSYFLQDFMAPSSVANLRTGFI
ncbi:hypothetical protein V6N12_064036 [Hibiscus sabdariffa]|uniref:Uncharacterized protein n=1 Tax=Hibiscus sabdariffa TaxID=183260 RepID=A0ABR2AWX6_9ROSI